MNKECNSLLKINGINESTGIQYSHRERNEESGIQVIMSDEELMSCHVIAGHRVTKDDIWEHVRKFMFLTKKKRKKSKNVGKLVLIYS